MPPPLARDVNTVISKTSNEPTNDTPETTASPALEFVGKLLFHLFKQSNGSAAAVISYSVNSNCYPARAL